MNLNNNYKNPYEILNLPYNSSIEDVKKSYKKMALLYHPDKLSTITDINEKNKKIKQFIDATNAYNSIINNDLTSMNSCFDDFDFNKDDYEDLYNDWINTFNDIKNSNIFKNIVKSFINMKPKIKKHFINVDISFNNYFSHKKKKLRLFLKNIIEPVFINLDCSKFPSHTINYFDNNDNEHEIIINMNLINDININKGFYHSYNPYNNTDNDSINNDSNNNIDNDYIKINESEIDNENNNNINNNKINIYYDMEIDTIDYILGTEVKLLFLNNEELNIIIEPLSNFTIIKNKGINKGDLIINFKCLPIKKDIWNKILDADKKEMVRIFQKLKNDIKI